MSFPKMLQTTKAMMFTDMTIVLRIQLKGLPENVLELVESVKGKLNTQTIEFTQDMSHDTYDEDGIALRMFILRDSYRILCEHLF